MTFDGKKTGNGGERFSCRDILWCLVFCGFGINYMLRINLSIAIVAMVVPRPKVAQEAECAVRDKNLVSNISHLLLNESSSVTQFPEDQNYTTIPLPEFNTPGDENVTSEDNHTEYHDRFSWDEYEQGLALGGYFWFNWVLQLPGGLMARYYGTKFIFGWANLATALLGFIVPFSASYNLYAFVFIRMLQGLVAGVIWPSMHHMTAKWIPLNERSRFISAYLGSSVGAAITYPLSSTLISWWGWESVFYVTSVLGILWYIAWHYLAFDTPQEHPRVSIAERTYILENLGDSVDESSRPIPWKAILTSVPLWLTAFAQLGGSWGLFTFMSEAPSYFNYVHGWNIGAAGVFSATPHLVRMVFSYAFASLADWILRTKKMSLTHLRKFSSVICNVVQALLLVGLAYSGCHPIVAIVFLTAGTAVSGALSSGTLATSVDLSPNYASILLGIVNTITVTSGLISPMIVGVLTNNNQSVEQWRIVFLIIAAITLATGIPYLIFGTSDLQPWNSTKNEETGEELQKLRFELEDKDRTNEPDNNTHLLGNQANFIAVPEQVR
ncbi:sialin [Athalia rosae]|uniref:sialin n=1 Tax=Athalia rosae TaxID=37344 RepID=UPI0020339515|nr:sialin [Athalia rosae]